MQGEGGVDQLKAELDELRRANTGSVVAAGAFVRTRSARECRGGGGGLNHSRIAPHGSARSRGA